MLTSKLAANFLSLGWIPCRKCHLLTSTTHPGSGADSLNVIYSAVLAFLIFVFFHGKACGYSFFQSRKIILKVQ